MRNGVRSINEIKPMKAGKPLQPSDCKVFDLEYFLANKEVFHVSRVCINSRNDISYHSHSYAELLWIEKGEGIHHVNGRKVQIKANDMVMIRPSDTHTFSPADRDGLVLVNIAFSEKDLGYYRKRYFSDVNSYFWTTGDLPYCLSLPEDLVKRFSSRVEEAMRFDRTRLQLDSLLLFIFRNIQELSLAQDLSQAPPWLITAINGYNNAECFRSGVKSFVALCGRNPDYVNRVVREVFDKTLTELVNDIRIKYAANQLVLTGVPIKYIAFSCGYSSLANFYRQFEDRHDQTPMDYRRLNQIIV